MEISGKCILKFTVTLNVKFILVIIMVSMDTSQFRNSFSLFWQKVYLHGLHIFLIIFIFTGIGQGLKIRTTIIAHFLQKIRVIPKANSFSRAKSPQNNGKLAVSVMSWSIFQQRNTATFLVYSTFLTASFIRSQWWPLNMFPRFVIGWSQHWCDYLNADVICHWMNRHRLA